jgi:hypothetical protein
LLVCEFYLLSVLLCRYAFSVTPFQIIAVFTITGRGFYLALECMDETHDWKLMRGGILQLTLAAETYSLEIHAIDFGRKDGKEFFGVLIKHKSLENHCDSLVGQTVWLLPNSRNAGLMLYD